MWIKIHNLSWQSQMMAKPKVTQVPANTYVWIQYSSKGSLDCLCFHLPSLSVLWICIYYFILLHCKCCILPVYTYMSIECNDLQAPGRFAAEMYLHKNHNCGKHWIIFKHSMFWKWLHLFGNLMQPLENKMHCLSCNGNTCCSVVTQVPSFCRNCLV